MSQSKQSSCYLCPVIQIMFSLLSEVSHHSPPHHHAMLVYRAGCLLDPCLDPEGCSADVLKAEILWSGDNPELTDTPGFGWLYKPDHRTSHHLCVMDLHVPIEKLLLTKVLQSLWFNEGGSTACCTITDGAAFKGAARLIGAQTQLFSGREDKKKKLFFKTK